MALTEVLDLDISAALSQLSRLEAQLNDLSATIPVSVTEDASLQQLQRDIAQVDNQTVDVDVNTSGVDDANVQFDRLNQELNETEAELRQVSTLADQTGNELADTGRRGASAFDGLKTSFGGFVAAIAAAQGIRVLARFLGDAVLAASELEQAVGGVESVFGEASDAITEFAPKAAQAVGLTNQAFLQLSAILGGQLQAFGFGMEDAADEAIRLVQVGADLAATYGGPVSDAVAAISSLLRGETNPIERYAIAINQAAINAEALRLGLVETTSQIGLQEKATAALSLLNQQSANAQGQFAREAETTAGQMERLRAEAENAKTALGESLIPAFESLLAIAPSVINFLGFIAAELGVVTGTMTEAQSAIAQFRAATGAEVDSLAALLTVLEDVNDQFVQQNSNREQAGNVAPDITDQITEFVREANLGREALEQLRDEANIEFLVSIGFDRGFLDELINILEADVPRAAAAARDALIRGPEAAERWERALRGFTSLSPELIRFKNSIEVVDEVTRTEAEALEILAFYADQAGVSIGELLQDTDSLPPSVAALEGALSGSTRAFLDQVAAVNEAQAALTDLPSSLDIVADTFRDKEGEIISDVETFIANLTEQAENARSFEINLARLAAQGFTALAEQIRQEGPEASKLLNNFLKDPAAAAEAEALARGQATLTANALFEQLGADIAAQDITPEFVAVIQSLAAAATDPTVAATLSNIAAALSDQLVLTPTIGPPAFSPEAARMAAGITTPVNTGGGGGGLTPQAVTENNITQNFYTEPAPTTETQQARQQLSALIGTAQ